MATRVATRMGTPPSGDGVGLTTGPSGFAQPFVQSARGTLAISWAAGTRQASADGAPATSGRHMGLIDFAQFVNELANQSGQAILPFFRSGFTIRDKSGGGAFDPVTEADRAGEAAMRQLIKRTFPTHGIIGEEFGEEQADAEYIWVLDPIDGTRAFMAGVAPRGAHIGRTRAQEAPP